MVQSVGHHAVSGLCYVHPHLGERCKSLGIRSGAIDLLAGEPIGSHFAKNSRLSGGADGLGQVFRKILAAESMNVSQLTEAIVEFQFERVLWPSSCFVRVRTVEGKVVEDALDGMGNRAEILRGST